LGLVPEREKKKHGGNIYKSREKEVLKKKVKRKEKKNRRRIR
jgi:hypothetical protein